MVIDGFQIIDALIVVVDIEQLMIIKQPIVDILGDFREGFLAFGKAGDVGHRVEEGQKGCVVLFYLRLGYFCRTTAAEEHSASQQKQDPLFQKILHFVLCALHVTGLPWRSGPGSRRWKW